MGSETEQFLAKMQRYTMADQYENVNPGDFDVVRSTQFVDDMARGVHIPFILDFKFKQH